jgi:hypothetical protein
VPEPQVVDPAVSRRKFDREVALHRQREAFHRRRGCFLIDAMFPEIFVIFASVRVRPAAVVAGVILDFTDYDLRPPSLTFVDPFTREPLAAKDLGLAMLSRPPDTDDAALLAMMQAGVPMQNMIQTNGPGSRPFLCLPGIREYHDNPAHTGDSWLLHRGSYEGSLAFILEKIWAHGVNPIEAFLVQAQAPVVMMTVAPARISA